MKAFLWDVSIQIGAVIASAVGLAVAVLTLGKFVPTSSFF